MELKKIAELEAKLGMNLSEDEEAAVITVINDGISPYDMDFQLACEITETLIQKTGCSFSL